MSRLLLALSGGASVATHTADVSANLRRMVGTGLLVAVGYIDPGNWATDIAGGSDFGYALLSVVFASALLAWGFQTLVSRLALVTGSDLATLTSLHLPRHIAKLAWIAGEAAILATALAELIGGAIALRLLLGIPLMAGVLLTGAGTFAVLYLAKGNADWHERLVALLLAIVAFAFIYLLWQAKPDWIEIIQGTQHTPQAIRNPHGFLIALGILGATLMPHNLYLHSGALAKRARTLPASARDTALRLARNDTALSLGVAMMINAAIMIVAASSLSGSNGSIASLDEAHGAIGQNLGMVAATVFAIALYAAGQSSTITGVLAGRILSEGFQTRTAWSDKRRALVTRLIAGGLALGLLAGSNANNPDALLVLSQVILSLALPFALVPLVFLARKKSLMGRYALTGGWAGAAILSTLAIILLDGYLLMDMVL